MAPHMLVSDSMRPASTEPHVPGPRPPPPFIAAPRPAGPQPRDGLQRVLFQSRTSAGGAPARDGLQRVLFQSRTSAGGAPAPRRPAARTTVLGRAELAQHTA